MPPAVTSAQLWVATGAAALLLVGLVTVLRRRVSRAAFAAVPAWLATVAAIAWALIYGLAVLLAWDDCYRYVLPSWARWGAWLYGLGHGPLALLFWWLARRARPHPVTTLAVLGALHSLPGHLHGILVRDLLRNCPPVRGVSAPAALTFGLFEFALYWMLILILALAGRRSLGRGTRASPGS